MVTRLIIGDCRDVLKSLAAGSVHCVVTSPPYFGLRSYLPDGHDDKHREIGLEETPEAFIAELVAVFREVRRVLRDDGTCWLNIGDSYAGSMKGSFKSDDAADAFRARSDANGNTLGQRARTAYSRASLNPDGLKPKDLMMMPARLALALQQDGWWLRSDIIWAKPNPMPESITDRPTSAHEHVFLLTKAARYFYDAEAVKEAETMKPQQRLTPRDENPDTKFNGQPAHRRPESGNGGGTRNMRNVMTVPTAPFPGAHFATFPPKLIEPFIKAGTSKKGCCPTCGAPWRRVVEKSGGSYAARKANGVGGPYNMKPETYQTCGNSESVTTGWNPTCDCPVLYPLDPCVVLDPFAGSGTVGLVCDRLGRDSILIDLSGAYVDMALRRVESDAPLFASVDVEHHQAPPSET